ncbi:ABC transporter ATP-binding protein [Candidatus Entotheonella palauensis]|uniref:ABC transporter ATP-binding protein n=1 Tax=Candidatus Entotheonella palauensis TaxID=93172 RepID=UPI000B7D09A7|nr:ABC transporter ATP-binding protein [Candidatus Entotheonella palauensis]
MLIRVDDVYKHYMRRQAEIEVLRGIHMEIATGDMVAIVGPSGAGKSTLLHLLGGLDRPSSGTIYYDDRALHQLRDEELADFRNRHIGFVFQFHHLLPEFSALENAMMPALIQHRAVHEARRDAQQLLSDVGLGDRLHHRPGELSGGEQQRVAVVRALVNAPDVVLADEPTGNLDQAMGQSLQQLLRRLNEERGHTFVIVTHDREFAAQMDRAISLVDGKASAV